MSRTLGFLLLLVGAAWAQDDADLLESTAKWRRYLERQPYHERIFDELVDAAQAQDGLGGLVAHYEALCAAQPDAVALRVLLARLLARRGEGGRASELLASLAEDELDACLLLARLRERAGDPGGAAETFALALARELDAEARVEVLGEQAEALRLAGDDAGARGALLTLAELAANDFAERLAAADRLEAAGFVEDAIAASERALALAGDTPRTAQALAELGRRLELQQEGARAVEAYERVFALLAHGHWLRAELFDRAVLLRAAAGTLEPWLDELRARARATQEVAPALDLARALELGGRVDEALDVLLALRQADEALDERILALATRAERAEVLADAWRRRIEAAPDDVRARLELAGALRAAGDAAAADRELTRAAELAADTSEHVAVARRLVAAGRVDSARAALERAATQDEREVGALLELAALLDDADALTRAEHRAEGEARLQVAAAWRQRGELARARELLEQAVREPATRASALSALAALLTEIDELEAARAAWRMRALESSGTARLNAVEELVASYPDGEAARAGIPEARDDDPLASLVRWRLHLRLRENGLALADLRRYLELEPADEAARGMLVDALIAADRLEWALKELERRIAAEPRERSTHLLRRADVARRAGRVELALADLARVRRDAHRTPELLQQVAARYEALGRRELAIEALEHARRLDPTNARATRRLGRLLASERRLEEARARLLEAWRHSASPVDRAAIAAALFEAYEDPVRRAADIDALAGRVRANPYDREAPALLLELLPLARRYAELEEVAALLLERRADSSEWQFARARARLGLGRVEEGLADLDALVTAGATRETLASTLAPELAMHRDPRVATALGRWLDDALPLANALLADGHRQVAADLLTGVGAAHGLELPGLLDRLVELRELLREPAFTLQVLEALEIREGTTIVLAHRIGNLHHELEHADEVLAYGRKLIELGAPARLVESYYGRKGLAAELAAERARTPR